MSSIISSAVWLSHHCWFSHLHRFLLPDALFGNKTIYFSTRPRLLLLNSLTKRQTSSFLVYFTLKSQPASPPLIKMPDDLQLYLSFDKSYRFGVTLAIDLIKRLIYCLMSFPLDCAPSNQAHCQVLGSSLAPSVLLSVSVSLAPSATAQISTSKDSTSYSVMSSAHCPGIHFL